MLFYKVLERIPLFQISHVCLIMVCGSKPRCPTRLSDIKCRTTCSVAFFGLNQQFTLLFEYTTYLYTVPWTEFHKGNLSKYVYCSVDHNGYHSDKQLYINIFLNY